MLRRRSITWLLAAIVAAGCASPGSPTAGPPSMESCPAGETMVCRGQMASKLKRYDPEFCTCEPVPGSR